MYSFPEAGDVKNVQRGHASSGMRGLPHGRTRNLSPHPPSLLAYIPSESEPDTLPSQPMSLNEITADLLLKWLWHGRKLLIISLALGAVAGAAYGIFAPRKYTANSQILIDATDLRVMKDDVFAQSSQLDMQLYDVESRIRILTSANVLNSVIETLSLDTDPEFGDGDANELQENRLEALRALEEHVHAQREEGSFIVNLDVWSQSAQKAQDIAAAIIASFQNELVKSQAEGAGRAATELFGRLDELKAEVAKADAAVQQFRREHNILSSSGELVSTLVVNETNTQLVEAHARVIKARSRYEELSTGSSEIRLDSASIESDTMTALRTQYATAKREFDAQSAILGSRHPRIQVMRPQIRAFESQIAAEQARMLSAAGSELAQAEASLMAQQSQANAMKSVVFGENDALVQLRELEREADSKASIYEAFMGRAKEIAERQQINTTNVRVISPPTVPKSRSHPPRTLYLTAAGIVAGGAIGLMGAVGLGFFGFARSRDLIWRR